MITIILDKGNILRQTTPATFGMNLYAVADPKNHTNPLYKANIEYMGSGFLRYHNGGSVKDSSAWEGLMSEKTKTWDVAKLRKMLSVKFVQKPKLMLNIPSWPAWMDKDGFLDPAQHDNYAGLMASLVKIVNKDLNMGVQWWEPMNEWDGRYFVDFYDKGGWGNLKNKNNPDRWSEVSAVFNKCAIAMKRIDPTIKVGGPAAARPDLVMMHEQFIQATKANLDFFSYHAYGSGLCACPC
jgi:Glycosyl hydrolases family 39